VTANLARPTHGSGPLYVTHKASFVLWAVLVGFHLFAYLRQVPRPIAADWRRMLAMRPPGRGPRLVVNLAAIAASAIAAILVLPAFGPWTRLADWTHR
jgi:hypothetical protein